MGTMITVTLIARAWIRRRKLDAAFTAVQQRMDAFGRDFWAWGDGRLARINRAIVAGDRPAIPVDLQPLFTRANVIREATDGLFDPRIGALVRLWGFDDPIHQRAAPPSQDEIGRARHAAIWDFGAIGKGWIVDECLDLLAEHGFGNASIDAGGNVGVRGRRGARAWRIGIRDPRANRNDALIAGLDVSDASVITHGDDQRFFEHEGARYSHIIDPRTGWPARGLRSITVVHRDGALADAAGAALFVAGREWRALAARLDLAQVIAITEAGAIETTAAMARCRPDSRPLA